MAESRTQPPSFWSIINEASATGFASFQATASDLQILVRFLRRIGSVTETDLTIKPQSEARVNTLSHRYGASEFPFHTDFAFRPRPPRYIVLCNEGHESARETLISNIDQLPIQIVENLTKSTWHLRRQSRSFELGGTLLIDQQRAFRWDNDFLEPANDHALSCLEEVPRLLSSQQRRISWTIPNTVVIIDNWLCAHARGPSASRRDDHTRKLKRLEVWQYAGVDVRRALEQS